ncbi:SpoIIE family protein phosphatase [Streptomyces chumphonensis]|uniref:PP2C family protein-serine/threonine phosphatase n=1 Tax=Streptomyces chumphonensis TaxID=1214925 RepID=UPI003D75A8F8
MPGRDEGLSGPGLLGDALADTVRRTGASSGGLYLLDDAARTLCLAVVCGIPEDVASPWRRIPLAAPAPVTDAVRDGRLVWMGSQDAMARAYPRAAATLPYRLTLAAAPLAGRSRHWGALLLLWPASHPDTASDRERANITSTARRITRALEEAPTPPLIPEHPFRIPVTGSRPHRERPDQAAADYAERLPEGAVALDLEGRITFLSATAAELLGLDADQLLGTRPWQSLPWLEDPVIEDHYRSSVVSREPVAFSALRPPDRPLRFQLFPDVSGISVRITPETGPGRPGDDPPAAAAASRTAQAGRLYQLVHLAAGLTETVAVRDVVELLADQVLPAFGADGLVLSTADAGRLRITGHHGYPQEIVDRLDGLALDTDLTPAGQVLATGAPLFFADRAEMARGYPKAPNISDKAAWAFLPLVVSGRPVGCCVLSYARPHVFAADERAVLTSLAGLVAQALDRARLYDAAHDLAHGLQQALLPRSLPSLPGLEIAARYLPASHGMDIGGDFYDVIRLDATTAAAVIGDVQGHHVAAAALMGQVRTAIHATAGAPPAQVLHRTNRVLADLESDLLVSCLYAHLDLSRHQVAIASAGHPPPLLHHPGRAAEVVSLDPAPLLGIDLGSPYPVTRLTLEPGTTLVLYTDGLVEAPGTDIDSTTADLVRHLAAHGDEGLDLLIDGLIRRVWPTGRYTDDIAMLLLRNDAAA